jgi:ABC-type dipeptide/oligopeptide/nickel transport system permease component
VLLRGTSAFNPDNVAQVREDLGLSDPLPQQFVTYMWDTARLNFGESFFLRGAPVNEVIVDKIWPTVLLVGTSTIASILIGLFIGIWGGWRHGTAFDYRSSRSRCSCTPCPSSGSGSRPDGVRRRRRTVPRSSDRGYRRRAPTSPGSRMPRTS